MATEAQNGREENVEENARGTVNDDVIQVYYPKRKKQRLREIAKQKDVAFQEYCRRLFDAEIEKAETTNATDAH